MAGVRSDRFGNATLLKVAKSVVNKKTGEVLPIFKTYFEGSGFFKVEISQCKKETKDGNPGMWVKFTKTKKNTASMGGGYGGGNRYGTQNYTQRM